MSRSSSKGRSGILEETFEEFSVIRPIVQRLESGIPIKSVSRVELHITNGTEAHLVKWRGKVSGSNGACAVVKLSQLRG